MENDLINPENDISNKLIIAFFIFSSVLVTLRESKEIFPVFNWALFAEAPQTFRYLQILVTSKECHLSRRPMQFIKNESVIDEGLLKISNRVLKRHELIRDSSWQDDFLSHLSGYCKTNEELTIEIAQMKVDTLKYWKSGNKTDGLEKIVELYKFSSQRK